MNVKPFNSFTLIILLSTLGLFSCYQEKPSQPDGSIKPESHAKPSHTAVKTPKLASNNNQKFINKMVPEIKKANQEIAKTRAKLIKIYKQWKANKKLDSNNTSWLTNLAKAYKIKPIDLNSQATWDSLLRRVNGVPVSLALAQSIIESAWGRSRFAREGHNYFGEWCYVAGCGMVPRQRPAGATYEVASFPSVYASIMAYLHDLNSSGAYKTLRTLRAHLVDSGKKVTGYDLAQGLMDYSTRRGAYVAEVRHVIQRYQLSQYD